MTNRYGLRFGVVYVDYETLERTVKDSGRWYAQIIENNGFDPGFRSE
jgi:beta-glucosidase